MKKTISFMLALVIAFSMSLTCFALTPEEAAGDLGKYGIMGGFPDGTLRLEENVTRAQITKMIVTAMGEGDAGGFPQKFSDVPDAHWASSYINFAEEVEIIGGFPGGVFKPDDNVTCEQALKMIICLLKYDKYVLSGRPQGATMYYPQDYIAIARDCDLTKDLVFKVGDKATRGFVAIVLSRALDTPLAAADQTGWIIQDGRDGKPLKTLRDELEK